MKDDLVDMLEVWIKAWTWVEKMWRDSYREHLKVREIWLAKRLLFMKPWVLDDNFAYGEYFLLCIFMWCLLYLIWKSWLFVWSLLAPSPVDDYVLMSLNKDLNVHLSMFMTIFPWSIVTSVIPCSLLLWDL